MLKTVKEYNTVEIYVESKNAKELRDEVSKLQQQGYSVSGLQVHYGKHGYEKDRTYYVNAVKKTEIKVEV